MTEIILATNNANKAREIKAILGGRFEIKTLAQADIEIDVEETGTTFAENAYIKAYEVAKLTGKPALSDDSGLEVEALGGAPGIYSARYAGKEQNDKA
ncbi:MAG TPA: non-canonical purine NTP pyrophosphatase, partial [Clostridia bacterium]|nr:non-canonical purine NTP pyrophosphatase [Clostridia bacterium]